MKPKKRKRNYIAPFGYQPNDGIIEPPAPPTSGSSIRRVNDNFLFFSDRLKIAQMYEEWREANNVKDCPLSVVTFLHITGLLDVENVRKELKK